MMMNTSLVVRQEDAFYISMFWYFLNLFWVYNLQEYVKNGNFEIIMFVSFLLDASYP